MEKQQYIVYRDYSGTMGGAREGLAGPPAPQRKTKAPP